jgi:hypothetical protein
MPNDISISTVAAMPVGSAPVTLQSTPAVEPAQAPPAPPVVNPTLRLDAALGLVVIEFRNESGAITSSIPSERQLHEYQRWQATRFGPMPAGKPSPQPQQAASPIATSSVATIQPIEQNEPGPSQGNS